MNEPKAIFTELLPRRRLDGIDVTVRRQEGERLAKLKVRNAALTHVILIVHIHSICIHSLTLALAHNKPHT